MAHYELMSEFGVALGQEDKEAVAGLDGEVRGGDTHKGIRQSTHIEQAVHVIAFAVACT